MAAFSQMIGLVLYMFSFLVLARVLISWVPNLDPYHPAVQFIHNATEPFLQPIRQLLPPSAGMDFSPLVLMIVVQIFASLLLRF